MSLGNWKQERGQHFRAGIRITWFILVVIVLLAVPVPSGNLEPWKGKGDMF